MSQETGKWIGIDYGDARIGIAISDPMGILARGLETIRWNGRDISWAVDRICTIIQDQLAIGIVIGVPRRTDGKPGPSEDKARSLAAVLHSRTGIEPVLRDERYTTVMASRIMRENGIRANRRNAVIDQIAAEIILQEYLESRRKSDG
jgi:putative holliday junction resolvase